MRIFTFSLLALYNLHEFRPCLMLCKTGKSITDRIDRIFILCIIAGSAVLYSYGTQVPIMTLKCPTNALLNSLNPRKMAVVFKWWFLLVINRRYQERLLQQINYETLLIFLLHPHWYRHWLEIGTVKRQMITLQCHQISVMALQFITHSIIFSTTCTI